MILLASKYRQINFQVMTLVMDINSLRHLCEYHLRLLVFGIPLLCFVVKAGTYIYFVSIFVCGEGKQEANQKTLITGKDTWEVYFIH